MNNFHALNLIDGKWQPAGNEQLGDSINPASGQEIGSFAASHRADAQRAIAAARNAFGRSGWACNPELRRSLLLQWADRLARYDHLAQLLTLENGKVLAQSRRELAAAISEIRFYAGLAHHVTGQALELDPASHPTLLREPAGVAGLIIPWNAPIILLIRSLAPALAAGCTVVIKPAPQTALITAAVVRELHAVAGLPKGVVNLVSEIGQEAAHELAISPDVDVIGLTGSSDSGKNLMAAAVSTMKKLSVELGGKSSCLVFPDVDIAHVAVQLAAAATVISGQQCTAARHIMVHASCYEEMKHALKNALERIVVGAGDVPGTDMGPLIDAPAMLLAGVLIEQALHHCDEVVLRGHRIGGKLANGFFLSPTLVARSDFGPIRQQDEIFGPFITLEKFDEEKQAIANVNNTESGMASSVWTGDRTRVVRMARTLRNGAVWIKDHNKLIAEAATGGYRRSGFGRLHGYGNLLDFLKTGPVCPLPT
jgi:betaine-aldehyde dehydrogenase